MSTTATAVTHARVAVIVGIAAVTAAAWAHLAHLASQMGEVSSALAMPMTSAWSPAQVGLVLGMWVVMMAAMMLPSAIPMVLTYDRMDRRSPADRRGSTTAFVGGYLVVWSSFAAGATALQWGLQRAGLVDGIGVATQSGLAGALLVGAGVFQLTPLKQRSLRACRTPMGFLAAAWRDGPSGALKMGLHHGVTCLGCCVGLMLVLFVLGVMNLLWVAALTLVVLVEKVAPPGHLVSTVGGVVLIGWGLVAIAV